MKFKIGDKVRTEYGDGEIVYISKGYNVRYLVKIKGFDGHDGRSINYDNEDGLDDKWWFSKDQLELLEKGEISVNEKMKRDLIKLLLEKEYYDHELNDMRKYKGRIIFNYFHKSAKFIDFIERVNKEYGIKGHEVADIIIKGFDITEYEEGIE